MRLSSWIHFLPVAVQALSIPRQSSSVQITSVAASGPGCVAGTFSTTISTDGSTLTLGFDAYQAFVFGGSPAADREKNCDIFLTVRYPLGCTTATFDTTSHGFAVLESGVSGTVLSSYSFSPGTILSGASSPATVLSGVTFAEGDVYTKADDVVTKTTIRNENERNVSFVVRSRVHLQAPNQQATGTLTVDDLTVSITGQTAC